MSVCALLGSQQLGGDNENGPTGSQQCLGPDIFFFHIYILFYFKNKNT